MRLPISHDQASMLKYNNLMVQRLLLFSCFLAVVLSALGCSDSRRKEDNIQRIRQYTLSQIADIKTGKLRRLQDPAPSLIQQIVRDPACAQLELLGFTDFGPDLDDPRFRGLRVLQHLKSVYFYCTDNTDVFLSRIAGMASLEDLETELADVSDAGMKYVAQCPNLKKLVLYGGQPSVGNAGLAELKSHKQLESLELINTDVTDDGLASLTTLPNLKSLVLFWEADRGKRLTDAGLKHLKNMPGLATLELSGGWASEDAVRELQLQLPQCKINTKASY
jgi:hypothetical protein